LVQIPLPLLSPPLSKRFYFAHNLLIREVLHLYGAAWTRRTARTAALALRLIDARNKLAFDFVQLSRSVWAQTDARGTAPAVFLVYDREDRFEGD
jgi:hypothetical protein